MRDTDPNRSEVWRGVLCVLLSLCPLFIVLPGAGQDAPPQPQSFGQHWERWQAELSNEDLYRLLWALPKGGDIHNHHEYSVPMSFWLAGAARRGYLTRLQANGDGCPEPPMAAPAFQWLTLRPESVRKLPACVQQQFAPVARLTAQQRQAWLSALTLDREDELRDEFFERIVSRLGDLELDADLMAEALVVAQRQLRAEHAVYLETQASTLR